MDVGDGGKLVPPVHVQFFFYSSVAERILFDVCTDGVNIRESHLLITLPPEALDLPLPVMSSSKQV